MGIFFQTFTDALSGEVSKIVEYGSFLNSKGGGTLEPLKVFVLTWQRASIPLKEYVFLL